MLHVVIGCDGAHASVRWAELFNAAIPLSLGGRGDGGASRFWGGSIDEVRITQNAARYTTTTSFTPPSAAFPRG